VRRGGVGSGKEAEGLIFFGRNGLDGSLLLFSEGIRTRVQSVQRSQAEMAIKLRF
jgi:hypothetical protein